MFFLGRPLLTTKRKKMITTTVEQKDNEDANVFACGNLVVSKIDGVIIKCSNHATFSEHQFSGMVINDSERWISGAFGVDWAKGNFEKFYGSVTITSE